MPPSGSLCVCGRFAALRFELDAYRNQYWPAQYIVDQSGKIVFQHDGEGQYEQMDRTIARLLNASS
jgi:hypothetical protein